MHCSILQDDVHTDKILLLLVLLWLMAAVDVTALLRSLMLLVDQKMCCMIACSCNPCLSLPQQSSHNLCIFCTEKNYHTPFWHPSAGARGHMPLPYLPPLCICIKNDIMETIHDIQPITTLHMKKLDKRQT